MRKVLKPRGAGGAPPREGPLPQIGLNAVLHGLELGSLQSQRRATHRCPRRQDIVDHPADDGPWRVLQPQGPRLAGEHLDHDTAFRVGCRMAVLCTNRRLGRPRAMVVHGEEAFGGQIFRGLDGDVNEMRCAGEHVVVLGMGAFAIENMRTSFERSAAHVDASAHVHPTAILAPGAVVLAGARCNAFVRLNNNSLLAPPG